jgi:hypothetical protein
LYHSGDTVFDIVEMTKHFGDLCKFSGTAEISRVEIARDGLTFSVPHDTSE